MKTLFATAVTCAILGSLAMPAMAGDPELCLDCHEPAEDWEGMSVDEIVAEAADLSIRRHADNADLSEEQLRAMIAELLKQ